MWKTLWEENREAAEKTASRARIFDHLTLRVKGLFCSSQNQSCWLMSGETNQDSSDEFYLVFVEFHSDRFTSWWLLNRATYWLLLVIQRGILCRETFTSPHITFKDAHKDYIAVTAARSSFTQQNRAQVKKYLTLDSNFFIFFSIFAGTRFPAKPFLVFDSDIVTVVSLPACELFSCISPTVRQVCLRL